MINPFVGFEFGLPDPDAPKLQISKAFPLLIRLINCAREGVIIDHDVS